MAEFLKGRRQLWPILAIRSKSTRQKNIKPKTIMVNFSHKVEKHKAKKHKTKNRPKKSPKGRVNFRSRAYFVPIEDFILLVKILQ